MPIVADPVGVRTHSRTSFDWLFYNPVTSLFRYFLPDSASVVISVRHHNLSELLLFKNPIGSHPGLELLFAVPRRNMRAG